MLISRHSVVWITVVVVIGISGIVLSQLRALDPVENFALALTSPLQSTIGDGAESVGDFFRDIPPSDDEHELDRLRLENQELQVEVAGLRQALSTAADASVLKEVMDQYSNDEFKLAGVVYRDAKDTRRAIIIDLGRKEGISEGMAVVSEGGSLVGSVTRAEDSFSWVTLLNDPKSTINALVQRVDAKGVVGGRITGRPLMDLIPQSAGIEIGDLIVTSGVGGAYPKGLLIGRVVTVEGQRQDAFRKATVEPSADLDELASVLVMTSFKPSDLERP